MSVVNMALLLAVLTGAGSVHAMWAKMTDAELVESSRLIVMATYKGRADANLKVDGGISHLGALEVSNTLKGDQREVIYLQLPRSDGILRKSDDMVFHPGQKGLWFLREIDHEQGIYIVDNPQRFVPEEKLDNRMDSILKLLPR